MIYENLIIISILNYLYFFEFEMSMNTDRLGSVTVGTTFPDIIINTVEGVASNRVASFSMIVHNPSELKTVVETLSRQEIPSVFADAVILRRQELSQIDDVWDFPLAASAPSTCPLPWTIVEAVEKAALTGNAVEYNIMRTMNFIGRNILRIELPSVSLFETNYKNITNISDPKQQATVMFLGAWYRDLIPRIISRISLYPRSASHELFVYSGYDIYIHNLIFGNERKEMNDLMGGEDKFELCYDPYRVDGTALGLNSFKGVDVYSSYDVMNNTSVPGFGGASRSFVSNTSNSLTPGQDTLVDYFQRDDFMTIEQFNDSYRKNVWYEAPIAQNYHSRHSIHSRRIIHYAKSIDVPLDILPFSYSLSSALSTAAISGECGFIRIEIYNDWVNRAFYCTRLSTIAPTHPIANHLHFQLGDTYEYVNSAGVTQIASITDDNENQLIGWVNPRSMGRFGDSEFIRNGGDEGNNFNESNAYSIPGNIVNLPAAANRENIISGKIAFDNNSSKATMVSPGTGANATLRTGSSNQVLNVSAGDGYMNAGTSYMGANGSYVTSGTGLGARFMAQSIGTGNATYHSRIQRDPIQNYGIAQTTVSTTASASGNDLIRDVLSENNYNLTPIVHPLSVVDQTLANTVSSMIKLRLFQIGLTSLNCVSELLTKLPNIYITTEWSDYDVQITNPTGNIDFKILNDLYQMANVFWFIPEDSYGIESMRYYACHKINHEMPLINRMTLRTQLSQGTCHYDWDMLNLVNPAYMGLNPLLENIGIISFAPEIHPNSYPLAYYDPNISGYIEGTLTVGQNLENSLIGANRYSVNMKKGKMKIISMGINGVVLVNLSLYRLVF